MIGAVAAYWLLGARSAIEYTTVPVARGSIVVSVIATGTVNPETVVQVGSYVSGAIQEILCDYNTTVKAGQLCAKIDSRLYQPVVEQAAANLAIAAAQLVKDKASLAYAKLVYDRNQQLVQRGTISQDAMDNARNAYNQASAQIVLDEATIDQRKAALYAAQVNLEYTNITSPVDGTVVSRNVNVGQTVTASFQTPTLFLIATDLTKMQVDTNVSESDIGNVHVGNKAVFTVEAFANRPFEGKVTQIRQAPITVQNVVTYDVVVSVENRDQLLKPGMTATTRIITAERNDVLIVPDQALRFLPSGAMPALQPRSPTGANAPVSAEEGVWLLRDDKPVPIAITTGLNDNTNAELVGGDVREGDRVVISASQGQAVGGPGTGAVPRLFGLR